MLVSTLRPAFLAGLIAGAALALAACAGQPPAPAGAQTPLPALPPLPPLPPLPRLLLMGEQHDQLDHQRQIAAEVASLAHAGRLRAVVMEMADAGRDSAALPRDADEARVRLALGWDEAGWPWSRYSAVVMAAVRAGVPVLGGNLPRVQIRAAMANGGLDTRVEPGVRQQLGVAVNEGHCGLLPLKQLPAMVRVQIARDLSLAGSLARASGVTPPPGALAVLGAASGPAPANAALGAAAAAALAEVPMPGEQRDAVVLLHAGERHVARDAGVPLHLAAMGLDPARSHVVVFGDSETPADEHRSAELTPRQDECKRLREKLTGG
jgi:uncharacterized iron-regulated protein